MMRLLIFVVWLFHSGLASGQENYTKKLTREVGISKLDSSIRFSVLTESPDLEPDQDKEYYWFSQNQVHHNKGGYFGKLLHGDYHLFDNDKRLIVKGAFDKGLRVGKWMEWYSNGVIASMQEWRKGSLHGEVIRYNYDGIIRSVEKFGNGKKVGLHVFYSDEGKVLKTTAYRKDVKHGKETMFINQAPLVYRYKKGVLLKQKDKSGSRSSKSKTSEESAFKKVLKSKKKDNVEISKSSDEEKKGFLFFGKKKADKKEVDLGKSNTDPGKKKSGKSESSKQAVEKQ